MSTRTIRTPDGRELCVAIAGEGDRTILVHNGTPNSRHLYGPWIEDAVARRVRLISYHRPGYGGSTPHPATRSPTLPPTCGRSPTSSESDGFRCGVVRVADRTCWPARRFSQISYPP